MTNEDFGDIVFSPLETAIKLFVSNLLDCAESEHLFALSYEDFTSTVTAIHDTLVTLGNQLDEMDWQFEKTIKESIVDWRLASNMVWLKRELEGKNQQGEDDEWTPRKVVGYLYARGKLEQGRAITKILDEQKLHPSLRKSLSVARDAIIKRHEDKESS